MVFSAVHEAYTTMPSQLCNGGGASPLLLLLACLGSRHEDSCTRSTMRLLSRSSPYLRAIVAPKVARR